MSVGIQEQNFGVEYEFTGITREQAIKVISTYFTSSHYNEGGYYDKYLSCHPDYPVWQAHLVEVADGKGGTKRKRAPAVRISDYPWYPLYADLNVSPEQFDRFAKDLVYRGFPMCFRHVGVEIACYNEQNRRLPFPIKVASKPTLYQAWPASKDDLYQGC